MPTTPAQGWLKEEGIRPSEIASSLGLDGPASIGYTGENAHPMVVTLPGSATTTVRV